MAAGQQVQGIGDGGFVAVVLKLLLMDLFNVGTIERIVSFVGVGLLILVLVLTCTSLAVFDSAGQPVAALRIRAMEPPWLWFAPCAQAAQPLLGTHADLCKLALDYFAPAPPKAIDIKDTL